jgi:hypothetical protein
MTNECILAAKYYETYRKGLKNKLGQEPDEAFQKFGGISEIR